jgi:Protein of unknown function (DUF3489)
MHETDIEPGTHDDFGLAIETRRQEPSRAIKTRSKANLAIAPEFRPGAEPVHTMENDKTPTKLRIPGSHLEHAGPENQAAQTARLERPAADNGRSGTSEDRKTRSKTGSKAEAVLGLLRRKKGASIEEMQTATGWQAHSLRGLLSGTIGKRMGLALESTPDKSGVRRYRIVDRPVEHEG